ncbi:MAG: motility associated factor glycosyltransferase family protein [Deltaproteobacteria bacterium]|nr:MAG: motility associated factor glycosyltransferase family protein [Deltaproteobacteria bacterium]
MMFENQFQKSLKTLQENHYETFKKVVCFLDSNTDFNREKFNKIKKLPKAFYDPETPSQNLDIQLKIVVWLGVVLGKKIAEFCSTEGEEKSHIIIEPSLEMFCFFLMIPHVEKILSNRNIFWIIGVPIEELAIYFRKISQSSLIVELTTQSTNFIKINGYTEAYFKQATELWNSFFSATSASSSICATDEYFGFHNSIINLDALLKAPFIQELKNAFKGLPGIVVSSGPSLNITLPFLKGLESKALIYCSDSSYKILKQNGITPHFVGCFERTGLTNRFLKDTETSPTFLIATSVVHKNVINSFPDRIFHFLRPHFAFKHFFPNIPTSTISMHSVAHLGLYSLWLMGCSRIYLAGQDLAFDPKTKSAHVEGHPYPKEEQPWQGIKAENNKGEIIDTDVLWLEFSYSLAEIIRRYNITCYNVIPEDYGIKINQTQRLTPSKEAFGFSEANQNIFQKLEEICRTSYQQRIHYNTESFKKNSLSICREIKEKLPLACHVLEEVIRFCQNMPDHPKPEQIQSYRQLRKVLNSHLKTLSETSFATPFLIGKNLDISKNMQQFSTGGIELRHQKNYLSFLSSLLGHQITIYQLLLKDLEGICR